MGPPRIQRSGERPSLVKVSSSSRCWENHSPTNGRNLLMSCSESAAWPSKTENISERRTNSLSAVANCHGGHAAYIRTKGAHEFCNMMWDPSIYRGNSLKPYQNPDIDCCRRWKKQPRHDFNNLVKRRKFPRHQKKNKSIFLPKVDKIDYNKQSFEDMGMQTDEFLEEFTRPDVFKDMATQPEPRSKVRTDYSLIFHPFNTGVSECIQCDLGHTLVEKGIEPLKRDLSTKVMEQSLIETIEEVELEAIRKENRAFMEIRKEDMFNQARFVEAQLAVAEERELALENEKLLQRIAEEAEVRAGAALFAAKTMGGLMPITFRLLKLEGYMEDTGPEDIHEKLLPYLNKDVYDYYKAQTTISRKMLDDMLQKVSEERDVELAESLWNRRVSQKDHRLRLQSSRDNRTNTSVPLGLHADRSMPFDIRHIK